MPNFPETRASLVMRIANAADAAAWEEFVRVYQPAIYRMARREGLQHADAEELAQEAMLAVARAVGRWVPDPERGRFRTWLFRIARNLRVNFASRPKHQVWGSGDSKVHAMLDEQFDRQGAITELFELEYRRTMFQCAAEQVRRAVTERTWQAFWTSAVEQMPIAEVAHRLQLSTGAVYIARNRVMARLRAEVRRMEAAESSVDRVEV
jgi:RNA polymerase sigma-70 factor (ECF subfamily)